MATLATSLDPGGTTGFVFACIEAPKITILQAGEFRSWKRLDELLVPRGTVNDDCLVIYEQFHLVSAAVDPTPIEVIGAIQCICEMRGLKCVGQRPAERVFVDRRWPDRFYGMSHTGSALRHLLVYVYNKMQIRNFRVVNQSTFPMVLSEDKYAIVSSKK